MVKDEDIYSKLVEGQGQSIVFKKLEPANQPNATYTMHPKEFDMFKMNNIPIPEDDGTITYEYNSDGFRSDDFSHAENKMLFIGCSEGEGCGAPLASVWTNQVFNNTKHLYNAEKFYNISVDNFGYQKIFSNTLSYIHKYGKPEVIVMLFPDIARTISWNSKGGTFTVEWTNPNVLNSKSSVKHFMDSLMNFIGEMHLFEEYCKEANIKLFWSIWSSKENKIFEQLSVFKNFIPFDYSIYSNSDLVNKQIRRDGHQGEYQHTTWATNISAYIIKSELGESND